MGLLWSQWRLQRRDRRVAMASVPHVEWFFKADLITCIINTGNNLIQNITVKWHINCHPPSEVKMEIYMEKHVL